MIRNTNIYNIFLWDLFPRICKNVIYQCGRAACYTSCMLIISSWQNVWQDNLYWLSKFVIGIRVCKIWFYLEIFLSLWRKFILKLPSKNISLSNFISPMHFSKHSRNLIVFEGLQITPTLPLVTKYPKIFLLYLPLRYVSN